VLRKLFHRRSIFCRRRAPTADSFHAVVTTGLRGTSAATDPAITTESTSCGWAFPQSPAARRTQNEGIPGVRKLIHHLVARKAAACALLVAGLGSFANGEEPISFVLPVANFQPVAADAYPDDTVPTLTVPTPPSTEIPLPEGADIDGYTPTEVYDALACPNCNGGGSSGCNCLPPPLPNGQYPDDWMWGCGQWPYANGPGMCDDWKVGPIWDVTVDGMVMTREHADLGALEAMMMETGSPEATEQFDRGPGGRVYLTGLLPKSAGYQVFAGYEGIENWHAAIVFPKITISPPPLGDVDPSERRSLFYDSSLHSGELNVLRTCSPAWRPYCGVRYIKFDDEIWDQNLQNVLPPVPAPLPIIVATETDTYNIFDIENNLIGFQGGVKYDIWQFGRRFSLQGFMNGGVYYNRAKWSNLMKTTETQFTSDDSDTPDDESTVTKVTTSNLSIIEESNIAYIGEASLTGVCRLNKCWACRAGYQVLYINGVHLAQDAYLGTGLDERSLIFHGWQAGVECRR